MSLFDNFFEAWHKIALHDERSRSEAKAFVHRTVVESLHNPRAIMDLSWRIMSRALEEIGIYHKETEFSDVYRIGWSSSPALKQTFLALTGRFDTNLDDLL